MLRGAAGSLEELRGRRGWGPEATMTQRGQKRARRDDGDEGTEAEVDNGGAAAFSKAVVQNLVCPITHQLFVDPYMAADGRLYEKQPLQKWLNKSKTSPVTNEPMRASGAASKSARGPPSKRHTACAGERVS